MSNKPDLTLIKTQPINTLPMESLSDFKQWTLMEGVKPSVALRMLIKKYNYPDIHDTTVIQLLRLTYPHIDFGSGGFRVKIIESGYPNSKPDYFGDEDFDKGITDLLVNPPEW